MSEMQCETIRSNIEEACDTIRIALLNFGFPDESLNIGSYEQCEIEIVRDAYDHEERVIGRWRDQGGNQYAHIVHYANGKLFAEHDVLQPHPGKPELYVEAMEVWGEPGKLRYEARLLPAL